MGEKKTVEVRGIALDVDVDRITDYDVVEALADVMGAEGDAAMLGPTVRWMRAVLGADYERVKSCLREANGGRLTIQDMTGFCVDLLAEVGAKN